MPFALDLRDKFLLFCGRRGCGKTQLIKHLIRKNGEYFYDVFVVSPSAFSGTWAGVVKPENIQHQWSEQWMLKMIDKMSERNKGLNQKSPKFTRIMIVLDDVLSSELRAHDSKALKIIASRGRHCGVTIAGVVHFLTGVAPMMRQCSDYLFYGVNNAASISILYEEFNVGDMNEKQFRKFVIDNTQDYRFLVINNTASNTRDPDQVYGTIKAPS